MVSGLHGPMWVSHESPYVPHGLHVCTPCVRRMCQRGHVCAVCTTWDPCVCRMCHVAPCLHPHVCAVCATWTLCLHPHVCAVCATWAPCLHPRVCAVCATWAPCLHPMCVPYVPHGSHVCTPCVCRMCHLSHGTVLTGQLHLMDDARGVRWHHYCTTLWLLWQVITIFLPVFSYCGKLQRCSYLNTVNVASYMLTLHLDSVQ